MAGFQAGWYQIKKRPDGSAYCMYFRSTTHYTAICTVAANGKQYLQWHDPEGPLGPGRPGQWLPEYKLMQIAPAGDWWDNPQSAQKYKPENPAAHSRAMRQPTARELSQRAGTANAPGASGLSCEKEIHVGIFFDGTNNNRDRDRPQAGHSNVVTLWDAHLDDKQELFRYYVPGVGTRFAEIGEEAESNADGNTYGAGGEARIHFGMLQVFNAVCRAVTNADLFTAAETKALVTSTFSGLGTLWRWGDTKMVNKFREFDARLKGAIEGKRPRVCKVHVSVIGFSRGAAQARAFSQWIQKATGGTVGGAVCSLRFLGIFDTVASVALAHSAPVPRASGFMDWANGTMDIAGPHRTVHFVAAHEIRRSFPLSTARAGGTWPAGVKEYVYPGAHSDVGGGYSPGEQGKATEGRAALLSQIPLNDLYHEALNAGVKVMTKGNMPPVVRAEFALHPNLDKAFGDYARWTTAFDESQNVAAAGGAPENRMRYHTHNYWKWRASVATDQQFKSQSSYQNANAQDRVDLWEAELDWRRDVRAAVDAAIPSYDYVPTAMGAVRSAEKRSHATSLQQEIIRQVGLASDVTAEVSAFFDKFVHDSHAGFWLLGPRTRLDKVALLKEIKDKQARHRELLALAEQTQNPGRKRNHLNAARYYELNQFERRVLEADAAAPGSMPVFSDADARELRDRAGVGTQVVLGLMGTATRREASGHGRYRVIFDQS